MKNIPPKDLLLPIPGDHPGGEDLTYSSLYDDIKEARRADDPSLSQGEWEAPIKSADWSRVRHLCGEGLRERAKDLQLAGWLAEAMTRQDGFAGAATGLRLAAGLLRKFWETLFPQETEERVGKLEWLSAYLAETVCQTPLTMPEHGGYGLYRWQESREVENLQRKGVKEYERALKEGRLTPEAFDKSARESGIEWFQRVFEEIVDARVAYGELADAAEACLGESAPGLAEIRAALDGCHDVALRLLKLCGGLPTTAFQPIAPDAPAGIPAGSQGDTPPTPTTAPTGGAGNRDDAVRKLIEAARYFREHEPHSPVAPLAERAARWAGMTLEAWVGEVIKDKSTVDQLHDLLGIRR